MKHKKVAIILFLFFIPSISVGVMRADFPDQKSLQPPPADVFPNISGNINHDGSGNVQLWSADQQDAQAPAQPENQPIVGATSRNYFWTMVIFLIVVIIIVSVWFYKWYNTSDA